MIILAHVGPPGFIFQFRNFDVPLMLLVAGISFGLSYRGEPYRAYLWKRVNRLVFPVWIFLSIYFFFQYSTGFPNQPPSLKKIVTSYLLISGIGYVWIIRVFLLVALVSPIISTISARVTSNLRWIFLAGTGFLLCDLLFMATRPISESFVGKILDNTLLYLLPYSLVFAIGLRIKFMTKPQIRLIFLVAVTVFISIGGLLYLETGKFVQTQAFKYPPTAYYLSFALAGSTLLWLISDRILSAITSKRLMGMMEFVAQNSIWVYLWHIPMVELIDLPFAIKYPMVFLLASLFAFAQVRAVERFLLPRIHGTLARNRLRTILTG